MELKQYYLQIGLTVAATVIILLLRELSRVIIRKHAAKHELDPSRRKYANKFFNFAFSIILFIVLGVIWDITFKSLGVYFASFLAIVGVALFAQWSIISSITASIILFFNAPFKLGSHIKIVDGDDSVEGRVHDITMFNIIIYNPEGQKVIYPNNLALQKPIILQNEPTYKVSG